VEAALLEHPSVAEVAVLGLPDEDLGERIAAFCVARAGASEASEDALIDHVARLLSPYKRPRLIRWVSGLSRNAMGKVQKKKLRAAFEAGELDGS
jgi:acyl-CoA synthetase (AMP-forming)/AMP-acid ligase II